MDVFPNCNDGLLQTEDHQGAVSVRSTYDAHAVYVQLDDAESRMRSDRARHAGVLPGRLAANADAVGARSRQPARPPLTMPSLIVRYELEAVRASMVSQGMLRLVGLQGAFLPAD